MAMKNEDEMGIKMNMKIKMRITNKRQVEIN